MKQNTYILSPFFENRLDSEIITCNLMQSKRIDCNKNEIEKKANEFFNEFKNKDLFFQISVYQKLATKTRHLFNLKN
jgi:hypothetical protein